MNLPWLKWSRWISGYPDKKSEKHKQSCNFMSNYTTRSCVFHTGTQVHIQDTGSYSSSSRLYSQLIPDGSQLNLSLLWLGQLNLLVYTHTFLLTPKIQISRTVTTHFPQVSACILMSLRIWPIVCWRNATELYVGETRDIDLVSIHITGMINTLILPLTNYTEYEHFTFLLQFIYCVYVYACMCHESRMEV